MNEKELKQEIAEEISFQDRQRKISDFGVVAKTLCEIHLEKGNNKADLFNYLLNEFERFFGQEWEESQNGK